MVISILGCGWYGKPLAVSLIRDGYVVKGSVTSPKKLPMLAELGIIPFQIDLTNEIDNREFFECDVLIISVPPRLRQGDDNYLLKIENAIAQIKRYKLERVIFISSTGVYGDHNSEVDELTDPRPDSLSGETLLAAELLFKEQSSFKTTIIRFAGLTGPGRHPGRFFAGKTDIPNGLAPVNLIHLDDCIGITKAIQKEGLSNHLFNACSPDHPAKMEFYTRTALQAGLDAPEFLKDLNTWKIVNSVNVPGLLNYKFKVAVWGEANY